MAKTSPGLGSWRMIAATASGIAPRCTGMCSAWATILPLPSKSAVEQRHLLPLAVEVGLPEPALRLTLGGTLLERGFVHGHGGDEAQVHELYGLVLHPVAVSPLVRSVEALLQLAYLERLLGLDRELEGLPPVAQIGPAGVLRPLQVLRGLALHALEELLELPDVRVGEVREVGAYVVPAQVGDREPQGAEDPSRPWDEHGLHAELLGEPAGVHAPGPAEG